MAISSVQIACYRGDDEFKSITNVAFTGDVTMIGIVEHARSQIDFAHYELASVVMQEGENAVEVTLFRDGYEFVRAGNTNWDNAYIGPDENEEVRQAITHLMGSLEHFPIEDDDEPEMEEFVELFDMLEEHRNYMLESEDEDFDIDNSGM